jgi:hypothetical protein
MRARELARLARVEGGRRLRWMQGGAWAYRAHRRVQRDLRDGVSAPRVAPPPPSIPDRAARGVVNVLEARRASCLERSLVLQAWIGAHSGDAPDVVIGVRKSGDDVKAHAWLDGSGEGAGYAEIHRLSAARQ